VETITRQEAKEMVENYKGGQFFTVEFHKRSDGSLRKMNCRKGVKKGLSGEGHRFNPASRGLVCVRDVQIREHRMIALESITSIRMRGKSYQVAPK